MVNIIDRTVELFAPQLARKRQVARMQMDLARAYDGASQGRRVKNWNPPGTDADAEISVAGPRLRNRSRDLVRSNPHAAKGLTVLADNIVGEGIMPRANTGNPTTDDAINLMFDQWSKVADPVSGLNFQGLQYLAVREMIEGGDVLARKKLIRRPMIPGQKPEDVPLGLSVQLLEADYLDDTKQSTGGKTIVSGVEFNKQSQKLGYWLYDTHPGNTSSSGSATSKRISAEDIAHLYEPQRTQARGAPWFAPVIIALRDLDEYEQAEIVRKKIEACVVGIVTNPDDDPIAPGINPAPGGVVDAQGNPVERFEPGMIAYARGGKDIKFNSPSVTAGHETYVRSKLRSIASGMRLPYELLTNDLSQINFSSSRVGILEFRRFVRSMQWHFVIPMFCQRIWDWFIEQAKLEGRIAPDLIVPCEWSPPRFDQISPIDDVRADILAVRAGFRSHPDVVSTYGRTPTVVMAEIEKHNEAIDKAKITLDTDPRNVTLQGMLQMETSADKGANNGKTKPE